jgi:hypothetical protein
MKTYMQLVKGSRLQFWMFLLLSVSVTGLATNAQSVELTQDQFSFAVARIQTSSNGVARRESTKTEELSGGKIVKAIETVVETDAEGDRRVVIKVLEGGKASVTESIWLGMIEYRKDGQGKWTKTDFSKGPFTGGDILRPSDKTKYSFQEDKAGPISTMIYTSEVVYLRDSGNRIEVTKIAASKFDWPLRRERTESLDTPENIVRRSITTYDYGLEKLDIKAPVQ